MTFTIPLKKRLLFLFCAFLLGFFIVSLLSTFLQYRYGPDSTPAMRILAVVQDAFLFIAPALATALVCTRLPAKLLAVDRKPSAIITLLGILTMILSIPFMNVAIWANEHMPLPDAWADTLSALEEGANSMVQALMGPHDAINLIVAILIVGVFAGLSEEILFRGALQRILFTGGINHHAAIWLSAIVFSALHLQFYGFLPRILLGAFFGYALYWSGSLWVPIILHIYNNVQYLIAQYFWGTPTEDKTFLDSIGSDGNWPAVIASVVLTAIVVGYMRRLRLTPPEPQEINGQNPPQA